MANVILFNDHTAGTSVEAAEISGVYTFTADDATANTVALTVTGAIDIKSAIISVLDNGGRVTTGDLDVTFAGNVLTIADGGTKTITAGDVLSYKVIATA